jgi:signal transduction histidine kinase
VIRLRRTSAPAQPQPLFGIVARRILLFALIAMAAQLVFVLSEYGRDPANLSRLLLEHETEALAEGLTLSGTRLGYELPEALADRYGRDGSGYVARIRTRSGTILYSRCDLSCTEHFLPLEFDPPSFWLRSRFVGFPLTFAGGRTVKIGPHAVFIEVAVHGDPEGEVWEVLEEEVFEHMLVPMGLTLVFVLGATLVSIRTALAPVVAAAAEVERCDPVESPAMLDTAGMPREIAQLAGAVNRSHARLAELVRSQKLFTSAIAHEIRTPLAVLALELERIDHPRARRALAEIADLGRFVDQVVALARLETTDAGNLALIDVDGLLEEVVASIAAWVYDQGATIALEAGGAGFVRGHAVLLKDAVRNLVENAVRHGGPGVAITVASLPGVVRVIDDGVGPPPAAGEEPASAQAVGEAAHYKRSGGLGIGLEIVRRIALMHQAAFALRPGEGRGAVAEIRFAPPAE